MREAITSKRRTGAHRIFHLGNAALSTAVFFITFALALVALDPSTSHYLLATHHRPPALNDSGTEVITGFAPVVVDVNRTTMLVVPAPTASLGTHRVSRRLDFFFGTPLLIATSTAVHATSTITTGTDTNDKRGTTATLSDLLLLLLLSHNSSNGQSTQAPLSGTIQGAHGTSRPSAGRHRNVLHLCSALACTSPFVLQQWSNRGTAAAAMRAFRQPAGSGASVFNEWQRVHNFAVVFGEAQLATQVMRVLADHHVLTPFKTTSVGGDVVMPLVGTLQGMKVVTSCTPSRWCRYSNSQRETHAFEVLEAAADALTMSTSKKRVFKEWHTVRTGAAEGFLPAFTPVRQLQLSSLLFGRTYKFDNFLFDLVYIDVNGEDAVAAFAFLEGLSTLKTPLPPNVVISLYSSEWLSEMAKTLDILEAMGLYKAFPLVSRKKKAQLVGIGDERQSTTFARWYVAQWQWLRTSDYSTPFLSHSHHLQEPQVVVLLSQQFSSVAQLQGAMNDASTFASDATAGPHSSFALERFFFRSLNVTVDDETQISEFFDDTEGATDVPGGDTSVVRTVFRYLYQHTYLVIPLTVAAVLVWSLCRPSRSR